VGHKCFPRHCTWQRHGIKIVRHQKIDPYEGSPSSAKHVSPAFATEIKFIRSLVSLQGLVLAVCKSLILYQESFEDSPSICSKVEVSKTGASETLILGT
jgi:hypothetical protein